MEKKIKDLQAVLWIGLTCAIAVALAVNGIRAFMGRAEFAYWHLATLAVCFLLAKVHLDAAPGLVEWFRCLVRQSGKRLRLHSRTLRRAVAAAALFTFRPFNRPQTEP